MAAIVSRKDDSARQDRLTRLKIERTRSLEAVDQKTYTAAFEREFERQNRGLQLIPSENLVSRAVTEALTSPLANKYAEGYPGARYYEGNEFFDEVENCARERVKQLFGAEYANVQPLSGSPANQAIYFALLKPGDKIMGMRLRDGGHLTHGSDASHVTKVFKPVRYGVHPETHLLDYDAIREQAKKEQPKLIVAGATAYSRVIDFKAFADIAHEIGAIAMADISHIAGLVVGGVHPSPFPHMDVVMTTTHKSLRGPRGAIIMAKKEFGERIDRSVMPGLQGGPHGNVIAAIAVAVHEAMQPEFRQYAEQVVRNAQALAYGLMANGFKLITNGTDNHLILVDTMQSRELRGAEAATALEAARITTNRNQIPFDPLSKDPSPGNSSGIRLGSPTVTTRGMEEPEMKDIAGLIARVLDNPKSETVKREVSGEVFDLTLQFPM